MERTASHDNPRQGGKRLPQNSPTPPAPAPRVQTSQRDKKDDQKDGGRAGLDFRNPEWPQGMRQRGDAFYFERVVGGQRYKLKLPFTKAQARRRADELNDRLASGGRVDDLVKGKRVSLKEFYGLLKQKIAEKRGATRKSLKARLRILRRFLSSQSPPMDRLQMVTPEVAQSLLSWRSRTPVARNGSPNARGPKKVPAQATITEDVRIFRSFFEHAVESGWLRENPFKQVKTPQQPKREFQPSPLDERQVNRLLQAAVDYDAKPRRRGSQSTYRGFMADMTRLFLLTGLRANEMLCLTWDQVELDWALNGEFIGRLRIEPYKANATIRIPLRPEQAERIRSRSFFTIGCTPPQSSSIALNCKRAFGA